jgi:hypothetical protein
VPRFANVLIVANIERLYREPVCRFLEEAFPESGIKAATWRRLFDHGWSDHGLGFMLLDGNAIVGFLGAIAARRQVNGEAALVCNVSSWAGPCTRSTAAGAWPCSPRCCGTRA